MTLDQLIERLHGEGRLRVWSLAVTIFGDAVAPRGGSIAMADLTTILERLGAEPGAIRTAMSRLARDGYVEREREGRRSFYRLAPSAAKEFERAAARIYAAQPAEWSGEWTVAVGPEGAEAPQGFVAISPGAWIAPETVDAPDGLFVVKGGTGALPDWARDILSPPDLSARYAELTESWSGFDAETVDGADAMAARVLLIHDWRRILLRDAPLPRALRPAKWTGVRARDLVADLYLRLAPASEAWLASCHAASDEPLPEPAADFALRFQA